MRYDTTVEPPRWQSRLMFAVFVLSLGVVVAVWLPADGPFWVKVLTTAVCLLTWPLVSMRGRITVDEDTLTLAVVPLFRKRLPLAEITSVTLTRADPMNDFGGYGYRPLGGGEVGFVFVAGPAAKVALRDGRTFVVAAPDADRLVEVLSERSAGDA
ncbi:hypothetical protein ACWGRK_00220 [Saccharomonospora azurea]